MTHPGRTRSRPSVLLATIRFLVTKQLLCLVSRLWTSSLLTESIPRCLPAKVGPKRGVVEKKTTQAGGEERQQRSFPNQ